MRPRWDPSRSRRPNPAANNFPGAYVFAGSGPNRLGVTRFWPTDFSDVGPRAGFAYQINSKTVLRGGFGIFYEATSNGGCGCTLGANGSFAQVSDGLNAPFQWDGGIPKPAGYQPPPFLGPSIGNGLAVDYMGPTFGKAPRIYNWGVNLQREIAKFLVEVDYSGNRGYRLNSTIDLNQVNPSYLFLGPLLQQIDHGARGGCGRFKKPYANFPDNGTLAQALRPFPQFLNVWSRNSGQGQTWYDAATVKVTAALRQLAVHQFLCAVEVSWLADLSPDLLAEPGVPAGHVQPDPAEIVSAVRPAERVQFPEQL